MHNAHAKNYKSFDVLMLLSTFVSYICQATAELQNFKEVFHLLKQNEELDVQIFCLCLIKF